MVPVRRPGAWPPPLTGHGRMLALDAVRFDTLLRSLVTGRSRRTFLSALASPMLAALGADDVAAKHKKKKKHKTSPPSPSPPPLPPSPPPSPPPPPLACGAGGPCRVFLSST